jgi:cell division protein FtsW
MSNFGTRVLAELRGDRVIWTIVLILSVISVLAVYSSTGTLARGNDTQAYLIRHSAIIFGGLSMVYIFYLLHYMQFSKYAPYLLLICIPLLVYTLAMGEEINNAKRWIMIPVLNMTFQTSDLAKLALIMYVARVISSKQEYIKDFQEAFMPIIIPILIICGLIAPADLSTSLLLFLTCVLMMFVGRVDIKYIWLLILLGIVLFALLTIIGDLLPDVVRSETWANRLHEFMHTDGGDQVQQSKIAMARGGVLGVGPGNSIQRNSLPSAYSDFIFAIIIEEYGLVGGIAIMGLYILLLFRCVRLVTRSPKAFGAMLVLGLGLIIVIQALANIAVSVHLVPVTGLTLPLMSMGGTSVLFTSIMLGMILSVSKFIEQNNLNSITEDE